MNAAADRHDLSPPADTRWGRPLTLALVAHGLLVAALTWGVRWQSESATPAIEAELWSRLPQEAAPRAVEPPPAPPPPEPRPAPAPPPLVPSQAEIALEQARKKAEEQKRQQAQREAEAKKKAEEKKLAEEKAKREREKALAEEKRREAQQAAQQAAERQKNLERMLGQAGASGGPTARGTAQQSSGPSASYAGRVVARIKPNIVFTDAIAGNPRAEVEVRLLPDGTIASSRLAQSSGNRAWDDAVLRAVERTGSLPRDENGRVPSSLVIGFRPND